jgi:hypothetical protein
MSDDKTLMHIWYRDFEISPTVGIEGIPGRSHDWTWAHKDYDGAPTHSLGPPSDHRCSTSATLEAAKLAIDLWWEEFDDDAA